MIQDLENEVWMYHPQFTDYAASNYGRIKSVERDVAYSDGRIRHYDEQLIKFKTEKNGYLRFSIYKNNKSLATPSVHRFVFECFHQCILPKDRKKYQINHLNEDKTDNRIENLELSTAKQNCNFGTRNKRISISKGKRVAQYDLGENLVKIWESASECGRNGFNQRSICSCCNGNRKKHRNFLWKYIEE